jgi:hypothetical protein
MFDRDKLDKRDIKHLQETGVKTKDDFIETIHEQRDWEREHPDDEMVCFQCKMIARKLGI